MNQNIPQAPQAPVARSVMDMFSGLPAPQAVPQPAQQFMPQAPQAGQPQQFQVPQGMQQQGQQAPQGQPQHVASQPQAQGSAGANGPQPTPGVDTPQVTPPASTPLDSWNTLFQNGGKQPEPTPADALTQPLFNITPEQVQQAVASRNFVGGIDTQLMQRALSGDTTAFSQVLNAQGQTMFANMMTVAQNMVERAIQTYNQRLDSALPQRFNSFAANASIAQASPALSHQAAQPVVDQVRTVIQRQNPNDPPHVVAQKVQKYFTDLASQVAPPQAQPPRDPITGLPVEQQQGTQGSNWGNFFS